MNSTRSVSDQPIPDSRVDASLLRNRSRRRSSWRQRLVDAERGISLGIRMDSTLFVHFFVGCVILVAGFVLRVTPTQWALISLSLAFAVSSELFLLVARALVRTVNSEHREDLERTLRIGTAAVVVALTGAAVTIGLIFATQLNAAFQI